MKRSDRCWRADSAGQAVERAGAAVFAAEHPVILGQAARIVALHINDEPPADLHGAVSRRRAARCRSACRAASSVIFSTRASACAQQFLAAPLERFAALVDRHRFLERHLALLQPLDDRFQLLDRPLEGQFLHVGIVVFGHRRSRRLPPLTLYGDEYSHDQGARRSILRHRPPVIPSTIGREATAAAAALRPCSAFPAPPRACRA